MISLSLSFSLLSFSPRPPRLPPYLSPPKLKQARLPSLHLRRAPLLLGTGRHPRLSAPVLPRRFGEEGRHRCRGLLPAALVYAGRRDRRWRLDPRCVYGAAHCSPGIDDLYCGSWREIAADFIKLEEGRLGAAFGSDVGSEPRRELCSGFHHCRSHWRFLESRRSSGTGRAERDAAGAVRGDGEEGGRRRKGERKEERGRWRHLAGSGPRLLMFLFLLLFPPSPFLCLGDNRVSSVREEKKDRKHLIVGL